MAADRTTLDNELETFERLLYRRFTVARPAGRTLAQWPTSTVVGVIS
jgi:hypothetical protein